MDESIVALAIEALERRKQAIQAEIDALRGTNKRGPRPPQWSAAARKAQRERMKTYWAKRKRAPKAAKASKPAAGKTVPQSAASKKAYWAKRKASEAKSSQ